MAEPKTNDLSSFMRLQPLQRNFLFFILSVLSTGPVSYLVYRIIRSLSRLSNVTEKSAIVTQSSMAAMFILISILTPIISLRRLHRRRIFMEGYKRSFASLFRIRNPLLYKYTSSASDLSTIMETACSYASGEYVNWDDVTHLTDEDKEYVRIVVEECIVVKKRDDDGAIYFVEHCAWLLVFAHMCLITGVLVAGTFSIEEIRTEGLTTDGQIGKVLSEWMTNYVLLIIGFLQIVTRGAWFKAFSGICSGAAKTMTIGQINSMVGLYIVAADKQIAGLRREGSYAQVRMTGSKWIAPPISTLIVAAGTESKRFALFHDDNQWLVNWNDETDPSLHVRMVGYTDGMPHS